ncbi:MAG: creatininase family protein [Verrucomicrobia bacterium]|nr:creatininase family protein [Verrucomicrobiota bacterium]
MTLAEIRALPNKQHVPVIIGTGAIEQHGRHLPVAVDALLAEAWLERSLALLKPETKLLVGPPTTFGKSNEHSGFPGTIYISKKTLRRQLLSIATQLHTWGFRVMRVLNMHGGNTAVLEYTLSEIESELGMSVGFLRADVKMEFSEQEELYGFHAGEVETSWMLEIWPESVDMAEATCEFPVSLDDPGQLRPEDAPATFSWASSDLSDSGVMGDASKASAEKGKRWMEQGSRSLAEAMENLAERSAMTGS